uniref:Uncharacterized protein n=1 Tax=Meloidogyne enterolobii TaxID=390850 RepID=A0A6V7WM63_MELEN|nr:unnamed protein product [Meloidogyne enterolobii]
MIKKLDPRNFLIPNNEAFCYECEACRVDGYKFMILTLYIKTIEEHLYSQSHINAVNRKHFNFIILQYLKHSITKFISQKCRVSKREF